MVAHRRTSPSPQQRVIDAIRADLSAGRLRPGDQMPSFQMLGRRFGVNHLTVRRAVLKLQDLGMLEVRARVGTFVRSDRAVPSDSPGGVRLTLACARSMLRIHRHHPLLAAFLDGADQGASACGATVETRFFENDRFVDAAIAYARSGQTDGLMLNHWWSASPDQLAALQASSVPIATFGLRMGAAKGMFDFTLDFVGAFDRAVGRAVESGCTRLSIVWYRGTAAVDARLDEAVRQVRARYGLSEQQSPVFRIEDPLRPGAWERVSDAIHADHRPEALIVWDEFLIDQVFKRLDPRNRAPDAPMVIALQDLYKDQREQAVASCFDAGDHVNMVALVVRQMAEVCSGGRGGSGGGGPSSVLIPARGLSVSGEMAVGC